MSSEKFCEERGLPLLKRGHSVMHENSFYQVFMPAEESTGEMFRAEFDGAPPSL